MADPNMSDFYRRVERLQKARAKGMGFEAPGTLGRSYYRRAKPVRRGILGPLLVLACAFLLLKSVMIVEVGREGYEARVASLRAGTGVEPIGGWLMQIDPLSDLAAARMAPWLPTMR